MRTHEITFDSVNTAVYPKPVTALVLAPDRATEKAGAMLFTHGWGGNRFQHRDKMEYACGERGFVCISVEYRMSGYDFNPVTGLGAYLPYDAGFLQTLDVLNGLRRVLELYPEVDRGRLFHYGGSQGGWIALLSAVYAPRTFAAVYASSPIVRADETIRSWTGREFAAWELSARDAVEHAGRLRCPVFLEHGTADSTVPHHAHTAVLEARLKRLNHPHRVVYYPGGEHDLEPAISKFDAFRAMLPELLRCPSNPERDDFSAERRIELACGGRTLAVDWSRPSGDSGLYSWSEGR